MGDKTQLQYDRLCEKWGPPEPIARQGEIRYKDAADLEAWEESCRKRATYALGRANGDGFWEAKMQWYGTRANWLKRNTPSLAVKIPSPTLKRVREEAPPAPMKIQKVNTPDLPSFEVTGGGWPSGRPASPRGQMLSGLPIGEKKGTSSPPENLSPPPSEDSLSLLRKEYL